MAVCALDRSPGLSTSCSEPKARWLQAVRPGRVHRSGPQVLKAAGGPLGGGRARCRCQQWQVPKICGREADGARLVGGWTHWPRPDFLIKTMGRARLTHDGFRRGSGAQGETAFGIRAGNAVNASVAANQNAGRGEKRVAKRASGRFSSRPVHDTAHRLCTRIQRAGGYRDAWTHFAQKGGSGAPPHPEGRGFRAATE
jgi:hypothetical protein